MMNSAIVPNMDPVLAQFYIREGGNAAFSAGMPPSGQGMPSSGQFINYHSGSRQIQIDGTAQDDRVIINVVNGQTVRVNFVGVETQDFSIHDVDSIQFVARSGDDFYYNNTSIRSWAYGHDGNDHLIGGFGADFLNGGNGDDRVVGRAGKDGLRGMSGNDQIFGGSENDYLYGSTGDDLIAGDAGNDFIYGDDGNDELYGGNGNDKIWGWAGKDRIAGQNGDDFIYGQQADDQLHGNDGKDVIYGGSHNDLIFGGNQDDRLFGEQGRDTINGEKGQNYIVGGSEADVIFGGPQRDHVLGGTGDDTITGNGGDDVLRGEAGADTIRGGAGDDSIFGGSHNDTLSGDAGNDVLRGDDGNDMMNGNAGADSLFGGNGLDTLLGGQERVRDVLNGNQGQDHILYRTEDFVQGREAADLKLHFQSASSFWTDREILVIDQGVQLLHNETGNSRLVTDYLTGEDLTLQKVNSLPGGAVAQNVLTIHTNNGHTSYSRVIQFSEWDENLQWRNRVQPYMFIHEISHNWDSALELNAAPGVNANQWVNFKAISNWRDSNPHNNNFVRSTDGQWWYHRSSQFARSYGKANPNEDWGTMWEYYFESDSSPPRNSNLSQKFNFLRSFFNRLK